MACHPTTLATLVAFAADGLAADLSILVDVEVDVAAERLSAEGDGDRLERLGTDFASRVREGFLTQAVADPEHWLVVDGTEDVSALTAHIVEAVHDRLGDDPPNMASMSDDLPAPSLFSGVMGQEDALASLRAAAANPVHAYLFVGPSGNGGLAAASGFAAALLCPDGGCGTCATCRAALAGTAPDLHIVKRSGATVSKEMMRQVVTLAHHRPLVSDRQVIVVHDMHLVQDRAPVLLKALEEPPGTPCSSYWPTR